MNPKHRQANNHLQLIDKTVLLISYPRSGATYTLNMINLYGPKIHECMHRTHDIRGAHNKLATMIPMYGKNNTISLYKKIILIIRNPYECFQRTKFRLEYSSDSPKERLVNPAFESYMINLKAYEEFSGPKIVIYYEDLMKEFSGIYSVFDFLNIKYKKFKKSTPQKIRQSMQEYKTKHKRKGRKKYNIEKLTEKHKKDLFDYMTKNPCYSMLTEKYLSKYI